MKTKNDAYIEFSKLIQDDENFAEQWHSVNLYQWQRNFYEWCSNYKDTKHIIDPLKSGKFASKDN